MICEKCGSEFQGGSRTRPRRFCSKKCSNSVNAASIGRKPLIERLFDRLIPEPNSGCWVFDGPWDSNGYGSLGIERGVNNKRTHILSFEYHKGEIPKGMCVCHKCDVPACCNPDHLFLGSHADNMRDMISKGRNTHIGKRRIVK